MTEFSFFPPAPQPSMPPTEEWPLHGATYLVEGPHLLLYRAEGRYSGGGNVSFYFWVYRAVRFTPCGAWVTMDPPYHPDPELRWVDTRYAEGKKLAHMTKAAAVRSLKARKRRQVAILGWQLEGAEAVLAAMKASNA